MSTDQEHLTQLAKELKAAGEKYVAATGRPFDPRFTFTDGSRLGEPDRTFIVSVEVNSSIGAIA
ncbi:MAG: hypothetical protein RR326_16310, partial [Stenotrophomonas sp.]